jgi:hypothetical protein
MRTFSKETLMFSVKRESVPDEALLRTYRGGLHPERWGNYQDCFAVNVAQRVNLDDFVFAFYTTPVFRLERLILRVAIGTGSTDADARAVRVWRRGPDHTNLPLTMSTNWSPVSRFEMS